MKTKKIKNKKLPEIPKAIIGSNYIEIYGNEEIVLTGKTEIIELGETVLKIKCNEHHISISGSGLKIINYYYDGITVKGIIENIGFERG